jgi:two-component sensor histidine kinase
MMEPPRGAGCYSGGLEFWDNILNRILRRWGEFDLVDLMTPVAHPAVVQFGVGAACAGVGVLARMGLDALWPGAGPYSLVYAVALAATLFGRLLAGLAAHALMFAFLIYYITPTQHSFVFASEADFQRAVVNAGVCWFVIGFAERFRLAVRRAAQQRDQEILARDLLLQEVDHRMKNNFAMVASLLDIQARAETTPEAREALQVAAARVHSFAAAHRSLYGEGADIRTVDMRDYLSNLTAELGKALFLSDRVQLTFFADPLALPRDVAVSAGIVLNEVVTNAAKHAFPDGEPGTIDVRFERTETGWRLSATDNGRGFTPTGEERGLGSRLIRAFAAKAGAQLRIERPERGTRVLLETPGPA